MRSPPNTARWQVWVGDTHVGYLRDHGDPANWSRSYRTGQPNPVVLTEHRVEDDDVNTLAHGYAPPRQMMVTPVSRTIEVDHFTRDNYGNPFRMFDVPDYAQSVTDARGACDRFTWLILSIDLATYECIFDSPQFEPTDH